MPALEKLTQRLGRETGAHVLFQNDSRPFELSATEELQLLRIAQETLANIRKHAQAHTVRVLLTRESGGRHVLLIEDDGVGFSPPDEQSPPGECIGLSILEERARRIGEHVQKPCQRHDPRSHQPSVQRREGELQPHHAHRALLKPARFFLD